MAEIDAGYGLSLNVLFHFVSWSCIDRCSLSRMTFTIVGMLHRTEPRGRTALSSRTSADPPEHEHGTERPLCSVYSSWDSRPSSTRIDSLNVVPQNRLYPLLLAGDEAVTTGEALLCMLGERRAVVDALPH